MLMLPRLAKRISLLPIQLLSCLCLGLVLQGCSTGDNPATEVDPKSLSTVIKSPNDDRQYRHIKLANEMDVLLISDSQAETSAASLDVYVGS